MTGYITIKHPITGEEVHAVPTGKVEDNKAEVQVITPKSNLNKMWISRNDILEI